MKLQASWAASGTFREWLRVPQGWSFPSFHYKQPALGQREFSTWKTWCAGSWGMLWSPSYQLCQVPGHLWPAGWPPTSTCWAQEETEPSSRSSYFHLNPVSLAKDEPLECSSWFLLGKLLSGLIHGLHRCQYAPSAGEIKPSILA